MSTPGRTDMLMKPTRVTHQALLSDQGLNIVVVFAHLGPLQAEALQQLASVGKTSRFWGLRASEREGFKGEWTEKALGANQHKEYWRTGNAGSFRANEWRNAVGLRGIESEEIWRRGKRYWMRGNARSFTAKARSFRANKWGNAVGLRGI